MTQFYPSKCPEVAARSIQSAIQRGQITQEDADLIRTYISEYRAMKHVKEHRIHKTTYDLVNWRRFIARPYRECAIEDIFNGINAMMNGRNLDGNPFAQNTKHDYVKALRAFLFWMIETDRSGIPVDRVRRIKVPARAFETTTPEGLLTEEEVLRLIGAARSSRDRALMAIVYETGARIGEVARLKWKDLVFDQDGVGVYITDTKTNKLRYSRCTMSTDYLVAYRNTLVTREGLEDLPVFMSNRKESMEYGNLRKILKTISTNAGIEKRVHWHLLRKSRITHTVKKNNIPESVLKKIYWGNPDTRMLRTYVVLSERDIDEAVLAASGIRKKVEETNRGILKERLCEKCHHINTPTADYCARCWNPLSERAISNREWMRQRVREDPAGFLEIVREMIGGK